MTEEKPSPETLKTPKKDSIKDRDPQKEIGGYKDSGLLEPTRYGDWDVKGRCSDF